MLLGLMLTSIDCLIALGIEPKFRRLTRTLYVSSEQSVSTVAQLVKTEIHHDLLNTALRLLGGQQGGALTIIVGPLRIEHEEGPFRESRITGEAFIYVLGDEASDGQRKE